MAFAKMSADVEVVHGQQAKRTSCRAYLESVWRCANVALQNVADKVLLWKGKNSSYKMDNTNDLLKCTSILHTA
jgi:hypothetical protein